MRELAQQAVDAIGFHRHAPVHVSSAEFDGVQVEIDATIEYSCATPMCCGEPACYTPFLGRRSDDFTWALATRLELTQPPRVLVRLTLVPEDGYDLRPAIVEYRFGGA